MWKALIIDDEPLACSLVEEYLEPFRDIAVVGVCNDGFEALKQIQNLRPDLLFLDVQMPKISGLELLELLDEPPAVIFTTAFDHYAVKAFEARAMDYLLKPFSRERFTEAVNRFLARGADHQTQPLNTGILERLVVPDGGRIRILALADIHYLRAEGDYVHIHSKQGKFTKKKTLQHYQDQLPPDRFLRIHRGYLLNLEAVTRIEPYEKNGHLALLANGDRIPVSRSGYQLLKTRLHLG